MRQAAWPWPWPGNIDPLVATHETLLSPQHSARARPRPLEAVSQWREAELSQCLGLGERAPAKPAMLRRHRQ